MATKLVIAALLVLGSSSVALAAPAANCETPSQPVYQTRPVTFHPEHKFPKLIANDASFAADGRTFVTVGADKGDFKSITITGERGRTFVKQVYVQFADGHEEVLRNLNDMLSKDQSVSLSVSSYPQAIKRIVVYGTGSNTYSHLGADFDITAV